MIRRKLADKALVVALAYKEDAISKHADWVLPVAAPFEGHEDVTTTPCSAVPAYAVSATLTDVPAVVETVVDRLNALLGTRLPTVDETIKERLATIEMPDSGTWAGERSAEKLTATIAPPAPVRSERPKLTLMPIVMRSYDATPLITKLYQESALYTPGTLARINPETARSLSLKTGDSAVLETALGSATRSVLVDPAVMPGVVEVALSAGHDDIVDICAGGDEDWRAVPVNVRRS